MGKFTKQLNARLRYRVYEDTKVGKSGKVSFYFKYYDAEEKKHLHELKKMLPYKASSIDDSKTIGKYYKDLEAEIKRVNSKNGLCMGNAENDFIAFGKKIASQKGSQEDTINNAIAKFVEFTGAESMPFDELEEDEIFDFARYLESCLKWTTAKEYLQKFKYVITRGRSKGLILQPLDLEHIKIKKGAPPVRKNDFSSEELNKLLVTPCQIEIIRIAFLFMCYTGLRISDLLRLEWGWLLKNGIGSSGKTIISFNMQKTQQHLANLVNGGLITLLGTPGNETDKVFLELEGISKGQFNYYLKKWAKAAGITKKISTHCGRVTFATRLYEAVKDINRVMLAMGHQDPKVTWGYINIPIVDEATLLPGFNVDFELLKNATGDNNVLKVIKSPEAEKAEPISNTSNVLDSEQKIRDAVRTLHEHFNRTQSDENEAPLPAA